VAATPEEELLLQVQGVIAEYERAKILERHRRGKRQAAKSGAVSVFSQAPYGSAKNRLVIPSVSAWTYAPRYGGRLARSTARSLPWPRRAAVWSPPGGPGRQPAGRQHATTLEAPSNRPRTTRVRMTRPHAR
jgi:hypothetical protein